MLRINPDVGEAPDCDTLWGVQEIARFINCPIRRGLLPD
jgi:hypothetical protein